MSFYIVMDCHSLGVYTVFFLSLLSFSVKMTVSPWAKRNAPGLALLVAVARVEELLRARTALRDCVIDLY